MRTVCGVLFLFTVILFFNGCGGYSNFRYGYSFKAPANISVYKNAANLDFLLLPEGLDIQSLSSYAGIYVDDQKNNVMAPEDYLKSLVSALALTSDSSEIIDMSVSVSKQGRLYNARLECVQKIGDKQIETIFLLIFRKHLVYTVVATADESEFDKYKNIAVYTYEKLKIH